MAKQKTHFICQECGYDSPGWMGKCPACNSWSAFVEEVVVTGAKGGLSSTMYQETLVAYDLTKIDAGDEVRFSSGISEIDRVLGGGIVKGSLILVGGDPGIGKSTLLLQVCSHAVLSQGASILYFSGEESLKQIKLRATRLSVTNPALRIAGGTDFSAMKGMIEKEKPAFVIIDSIQTMYDPALSSAPGSISQVREVTAALMILAKTLDITIFIVGHVTKEGSIAGPRALEHMVDTVLYFEGEKSQSYRILRAVKNRFGSTNEIGIFEMRDSGLSPVDNPSGYMLSGRPKNAVGSVVMCGMEGTRPMLIEIQALVSPTVFGLPRRMTNGVDQNRVALLMAVLEKKVGLNLGSYDAYINIVGGIKIDEPAADLGIMLAIASSFKNIPIKEDTMIVGETGLTGEIRSVSSIENRILEAERMGFSACLIPEGNAADKSFSVFSKNRTISVLHTGNVASAIEIALG